MSTVGRRLRNEADDVTTPNEQLREQIRAMAPGARARFERQVAEQLKRSADRQGKPVPAEAARILGRQFD